MRLAADLIHGPSEDLDPALRRSTELMVNELDRFETLLADLLEISRHDAGVAELVGGVGRSAFRGAERAGQRRAPGRRRRGRAGRQHAAGEVIAEVDPRRVERILRNLIASAIDHAERKPVQIRMAADEDTVAVTVRDSGVGLRLKKKKGRWRRS